jgi:hypothetical protein
MRTELTPVQRAARATARADLNRRLRAAESALYGAPVEWAEDWDAPMPPPARSAHQRSRRAGFEGM